jgi:hypothetical protein
VLVERVLTRIITAALVDTNSLSEAPALCASMDLFGACPETANGPKAICVPSVQEVSLDLAPIVHPDGKVAFIRDHLDPMAQGRTSTRASLRAPPTWPDAHELVERTAHDYMV